MRWLRWHHGTVTDPKFRLIAAKSGTRVCEVVAVWATILENASDASDRGTLEGWRDDVTAVALDMETDRVAEILATMRSYGLLDDSGRVTSWKKRQPKREDDSAERMRRHRERKRRAGDDVTHGDAPVTRSDAPEESREEESNPPVVPPAGGKQRNRGSRLPDDWTLPDEWRRWAVENTPGIDVDREAAKFADYWHAKSGAGAAKKDWRATWRNWCRTAEERAGPGRGQSYGGDAPRQPQYRNLSEVDQ
ncbi:hypothetical protein KBTX_02782 [wastewater metagenome]|uniref:DnaT DNA-binding domain-containing protein n=2 Tax=unclassified sequences TaxID=12908 RepID=A0A5B8RG07_9ZZZZ|nr:hypothetical protein [Arhodomonas sp. KWT]QEA06444.1 hypothetical protein KBTEX_02782 [uncultured organism]